VTAEGPGLVAVGQDWSRAYGYRAAVWTSVDGITWSRIPHDENVFGGGGEYSMRSVTVWGPDLVASGQNGRGHVMVWFAVAEYTPSFRHTSSVIGLHVRSGS
jgi:hypothetical protein